MAPMTPKSKTNAVKARLMAFGGLVVAWVAFRCPKCAKLRPKLLRARRKLGKRRPLVCLVCK